MIGFINLDKPVGPTSHTMVAHIRRIVGRKVRVGHAGTLDPAASGVLPLAVGSATRLISYLTDATKGYRATVQLGSTTTTDDAEGDVLTTHPVPPLDRPALAAALAPFRGDIWQVPPMYAALHHEGKRLYELARAGQTVERPPRPVTIISLALVVTPDAPLTAPITRFVLNVRCSKGTYIRALARDIGAALGCGAHLAALQRTAVGDFVLAAATPPTDLYDHASLAAHLLPPDIAVRDWVAVTVSDAEARALQHGQGVLLDLDPAAVRARAHLHDGKLLALLVYRDGIWHPDKVLLPAP